MDDRELREILAELYEADTNAPGRHIRDGNGSVLLRADVALAAMRRVATPQSMTITDELIDRVSNAICRALGHSSYDPYMAASGIQPESECVLAAKAALQAISNPQEVSK